MISDDAPDPRNGKIIQCRVLARTLWVPWAGSLAGPWREAPCHYAAGPHHPHQYSIFGAPPQRASSTNPSGTAAAALLSFSTARAVSSPAGGPVVIDDATILRRHSATSSSVCLRCGSRESSSWESIRAHFLPHDPRYMSTVVNSFQNAIEGVSEEKCHETWKRLQKKCVTLLNALHFLDHCAFMEWNTSYSMMPFHELRGFMLVSLHHGIFITYIVNVFRTK